MSEQKTAQLKVKKTPWFAWTLFIFVFMLILFQTFRYWQRAELTDKLMGYDENAGVVVNQISVNDMDDVELDILRDPDAISVNDWLKENNLTIKQIALTERRFQSLDPNILKVRGERILKKYPQIDMSWQANTLVLSGNIGVLQFEKLLSVLSIAGFTAEVNLSIDQVKHISTSEFETNNAVKEQLFEALVGRITTIQLDFAVESAEISAEMQVSLEKLSQYLTQLNELASQLNFNIGLLVIGCSDNSGNKLTNTQLSLQRAKNTQQVLNQLGVIKDQIYVTGLGQIDIKEVQNNARKVMFNVLYVDNKGTK